MPPSAGRVRLMRRRAFQPFNPKNRPASVAAAAAAAAATAAAIPGAAEAAAAAAAGVPTPLLLRKDPGRRAASETRFISLEKVPPSLIRRYVQHKDRQKEAHAIISNILPCMQPQEDACRGTTRSSSKQQQQQLKQQQLQQQMLQQQLQQMQQTDDDPYVVAALRLAARRQ